MSRFRKEYSVLESAWAINKDTNEIVGIRILYFDVQMMRPFMIELVRGDAKQKRMSYAHVLERSVDAHTAYQFFESYKDMFFENTIELKPEDHPFIAKFVREKESHSKRYHPGSDWRYKYGMPPVIFSSSFMRYFKANPVSSTIGWALLVIASMFGLAHVF